MVKALSALRISDTLALPIEAAVARFVILGKSGSGKTTAGAVLAEELYAAGVTLVVLDRLGNTHGLRAAGTGAGLPIAILGGLNGDVPIRADRGAVVADLVASGVSAVLDLSQMTREDAQQFAADFFDRIVPAIRESGRNVHVIVEEAETFAPERVTGKLHNTVRAAATVFARTARNYGIGWTFSTQRPQLLAKDVIDSSTAFLAMKMTGDLAQEAIGAEARSRAGKVRAAEIITDLPNLRRGEAWLVPDLDWLGDDSESEPVKFRFRWRHTFDSARPPKVGERREEPRVLADVDLESLRAAMAAEPASDSPQSGTKVESVRVERVEVPILDEIMVINLNQHISETQESLRKQEEAMASLRVDVDRAATLFDRIVAAMAKYGTAPGEPAQGVAPDGDSAKRGGTRRRRESAPTGRPRVEATALPRSPSPSGAGDVGGGPRKILAALAATKDRAATRTQLAFLAGFSHGGGSYARYLTTLRAAHAIVDQDGRIYITAAGEAILGPDAVAPAATTRAVLAMFRSKLGAGPTKMFDALVGVWPSGLTRDALAAASGYEASGGSFARYLTSLSSAQLIERKGGVIRLVDELFPTGKVKR